MSLFGRSKDAQRSRMVRMQLAARGISDQRVLDAFDRVPRHEFVPKHLRSQAYDDHPLPIGERQTISQPYMVAIMLELLKLDGSESVYEVGTGSGYQTALLAELARVVYSTERVRVLADRARELIERLEYDNVEIQLADGTLGWPERAPFDRIVVSAGAPSVPQPLVEQLAEGGRMVLPVGPRHYQILTLVLRVDGEIKTEEYEACRFVDLIGEFGWSH